MAEQPHPAAITVGLESVEFDDVVTLTRDEIIAKRQAILDRYGLAEKDMEADDCRCCPKGNYIPWIAFRDWRELGWLLGDDE